jgi:hypothetical protein
MSNREGRRGVSKAFSAGVIREHTSPCETGWLVINEPAPVCLITSSAAQVFRGAMLFALLPPMPFGPRLVCGVLGTIFTGVLNLVFRRARWRWHQFALALGLSPLVILAASRAGLASGDRTEYVFLGGVVAIGCIRGSPTIRPLPDYSVRAWTAIGAAIAFGPVMGLVAHWLRYLLGWVDLLDDWEIRLSLEDGVNASFAGAVLMVILIIGSRGLSSRATAAALLGAGDERSCPAEQLVAPDGAGRHGNSRGEGTEGPPCR